MRGEVQGVGIKRRTRILKAGHHQAAEVLHRRVETLIESRETTGRCAGRIYAFVHIQCHAVTMIDEADRVAGFSGAGRRCGRGGLHAGGEQNGSERRLQHLVIP